MSKNLISILFKKDDREKTSKRPQGGSASKKQEAAWDS